MRACETSRDVEPHKQVGLSPLVASRRPRGAERNGLAWKPVAEDHRTGVEGIEGVMSLWKRAHGAQRGFGPLVWKRFTMPSASVRCGLCKRAEATRSVETDVKRPTAL